MVVMGHQIGQVLCDALGLPKGARGFTLRCYVNEIVSVECEYYPDIDKSRVALALAQYELAHKPEQTQAETMHFDTWMRDRTEAAHAAYMAQHSDGGITYTQ